MIPSVVHPTVIDRQRREREREANDGPQPLYAPLPQEPERDWRVQEEDPEEERGVVVVDFTLP